MIFFLLYKKWEIYFDIKRNWAKLLVELLWLLFLVSLAILTAFMYDSALQQIIKVMPSSIIKGVEYSLLLLPMVMKFLPSVSPPKVIFKRNYPVPHKKMLIFDLLYSILSETWIFFMFIVCFILLIYSSISLFLLTQFITIGLSGILLATNLINIYYNDNKNYFFLILISIFTIALLIQGDIFLKYPLLVYITFISLCVVFSLSYKPLRFDVSRKVYYILTETKYITLKISARNKRYMKASFGAIILQIIAAFVFTTLLKRDIAVVVFYLISFSFVFSYCYNNAWGFFTSTGLNLIIAGSRMKEMLIVLFKFLLPVIFLYFSFYIIYFCFFPWVLTWTFVIGFVTLAFFSFIIAVLFSFMKMRSINKPLSLRANNYNTNIIATHIVGIVCLLVGYSQENTILFFLMIGTILVLSIISFLILFKKQSELIKVLTGNIIDGSPGS